MAFRTTGIGSAGNRFTVAALTVLAYQHFAVFAIDSQKFFAALRTYFVGKIVVAERALDRKSTRLNSSHIPLSCMPSSA